MRKHLEYRGDIDTLMLVEVEGAPEEKRFQLVWGWNTSENFKRRVLWWGGSMSTAEEAFVNTRSVIIGADLRRKG